MTDNSDFITKFNSLTKEQRRDVALCIEDEPYSWNVVDMEVRWDTPLSRLMLLALKEMKKI